MAVTSENRRPAGPRYDRPEDATLRQLYVSEDLPMNALASRYRVGKVTLRSWLVEAGIPIRTRREAGGRRLLAAPPDVELRRLYEDEGRSVSDIAHRLRVSETTARRWVAEAGIALRRSPLKNRRRGQSEPLVPPGVEMLTRLYVEEGRSLADVAAYLGASVHLVRSWMTEAGIRSRPARAAGRAKCIGCLDASLRPRSTSCAALGSTSA